MNGPSDFVLIISLIIFVYTLYWMISMLKAVKEQRILISTLLIAIKKIAEKQDIDIDLKEISDDVIKKIK